MIEGSFSKKESLNLLKIEQITNLEWFRDFEQLDDTLTKCLLLVAMMSSQELISAKEAR